MGFSLNGGVFKREYSIDELETIFNRKLINPTKGVWGNYEPFLIGDNRLLVYVKNGCTLLYFDNEIILSQFHFSQNEEWVLFSGNETSMHFHLIANLTTGEKVNYYSENNELEIQGENILNIAEDNDIIWDGIFKVQSEYLNGTDDADSIQIFELGDKLLQHRNYSNLSRDHLFDWVVAEKLFSRDGHLASEDTLPLSLEVDKLLERNLKSEVYKKIEPAKSFNFWESKLFLGIILATIAFIFFSLRKESPKKETTEYDRVITSVFKSNSIPFNELKKIVHLTNAEQIEELNKYEFWSKRSDKRDSTYLEWTNSEQTILIQEDSTLRYDPGPFFNVYKNTIKRLYDEDGNSVYLDLNSDTKFTIQTTGTDRGYLTLENLKPRR